MAAFSSTSFDTSAFSVEAFDFGDTPPPTPPAATGVRPSGGFPAYDSGPTKKQKKRSRVVHGIEAEVIAQVASRQAQSLDLDELQRKEELLAELSLRNIEARTEHFAELARSREALIDAEIARRIQAIYAADLEAAAMLMIIAAAL